MPRVFVGRVVKVKMEKTVVVEITRLSAHPLYKKLLHRSTRLHADTSGFELKVGDIVRIRQTRPLSKRKHFKVIEVVKP